MLRLASCLALFALVGCKPDATPPPKAILDDVDVLLKIAKLPVRPVSTKFEVELLGEPSFLGPTDERLLAVFEVAEADVPKVLAGLEPAQAALHLEDRDWFPADVKAALEPAADAKGRHVLKGRSYRAEPFTRMPFRGSILTHLEGTSRFFLTMHTM